MIDDFDNSYVVYNDRWTWRDYVSLAVFPFVLVGCCVAGLICEVMERAENFPPLRED